MARHRELAETVYARVRGRSSASKIWRTVVVAGAMLAAPMSAAAEQKAPPATERDAPPPVDKATEAKRAKEVVKTLELELEDLDKKITAQTKAVKDAQNQAERDAANAKLTAMKKEKTDLKARIVTAKADAKKADEAAKAEAKAKNPPRPRVQQNTRPVGRGFILS